jgi:hypothetical protein
MMRFNMWESGPRAIFVGMGLAMVSLIAFSVNVFFGVISLLFILYVIVFASD